MEKATKVTFLLLFSAILLTFFGPLLAAVVFGTPFGIVVALMAIVIIWD